MGLGAYERSLGEKLAERARIGNYVKGLYEGIELKLKC